MSFQFPGFHTCHKDVTKNQFTESTWKIQMLQLFEEKQFSWRGGRNLDVAKASVQKAVNRVRQPKLKHSRPNQFGNPMFRYISSRRRCGDQRSQESIIAEWKRLPPNEKLLWRARQRVQCQMQREQNSNAAQWGMRQQEETQVSTAWNLGNSDYPIAPELIADYLKTFETKRTGFQNFVKWVIPKFNNMLNQWSVGSRSTTRCTLVGCCAKPRWGSPFPRRWSTKMIKSRKSWGAHSYRKGVAANTLALCKGGVEHNGGKQILSLFPKKSCMLRLELKAGRGSNIVYLRCIEGPRKFFLFFQHRWLMGMPHHSISKMWGQQFFRKIHSTVYWIHERCL